MLSAVGIHKLPAQWDKATKYQREKYLDRYYEYRTFNNASDHNFTGPNSVHVSRINIHRVLKFILGVNENNCKEWVLFLCVCVFIYMCTEYLFYT